MKKIAAIDEATGIVFHFTRNYRYGTNPAKLYGGSPLLATEDAFSEIKFLHTATPGDEIFIEWSCDRFYVLDQITNEHVAGPAVWRKSSVIGPVKTNDRSHE